MTFETHGRIKRHHRKSIRLKGYDYQNGGMYFVTICTKNRECVFGEIKNGIMGLSEMGCVVAQEIQKTSIIRPYVNIDTWIIMPNHVHILLWVDDVIYRNNDHWDVARTNIDHECSRGMACENINETRRGMARHAPTEIVKPASHAPTTNMPIRYFGKPQGGSLGTIIGSFKSAVTKHINTLRDSPGADVWQRNYYERIVRSEKETIRIQRYIMDNPIHWMIDEHHPPLA